jgi:beta-glucanase (GH16 family)
MCGEIDVMELIGSNPKRLLGYLHGPISGGMGRGNTKDFTSALTDDFHTYTIDWLPDEVTWYIDGVKYGSVSRTDLDWRFDKEFYVVLNLAMGGNLGGTIDAGLTSTTMQVDYVRYSTINGIGTLHLYPQG